MEAVQAFLSSERQSLRQDLRESKASGRLRAVSGQVSGPASRFCIGGGSSGLLGIRRPGSGSARCEAGWRLAGGSPVDLITQLPRFPFQGSKVSMSKCRPNDLHAPHARLPSSAALQASAIAAELVPAVQAEQLPAAAGGGSNWQKKGGGAATSACAAGAAAGGAPPSPAAAGPWAEALGSAALLGGGLDGTEAELAAAGEAAAAARGGPRQQLVVVASLLTKAPNLAGLARTCEVFR